MRFFITPNQNTEIDKYLKKDEYKSCRIDLCEFFSGKTCDEITARPILLTVNNSFYFIKSRLQNSTFNKGKSGGYRLYYYVCAKTECVYLIGFYPKTGKYGREDLTDTELKIAVKDFSAAKNSDTLLELDEDNNFEVKKINLSLSKETKVISAASKSGQ